MIQEHEMNIPVSKEVYKKCRQWIETNQCYNNVWNVITNGYGQFFHQKKWKIAYGYVSAIENIMARHCFIVDENGQAIDPTAIGMKHFKEDNPKHYISFKILDFDEYLETVEQHDLQPNLYQAFLEEEKQASEWATLHNLILYQ